MYIWLTVPILAHEAKIVLPSFCQQLHTVISIGHRTISKHLTNLECMIYLADRNVQIKYGQTFGGFCLHCAK